MPHATLTIDNNTVLDDDLQHWQQRAPEELSALITSARTENKPWLKAAMLPLVEAIAAHRDVKLVVHTRPRGWTLRVDHP